MSTQQTGGLKPSRRTLVKGAAWSVPVVAVAGAAPAMAASCLPTFTLAPTSVKCCSGKVKSYKLDIIVTDTSGCVAAGASICIQSILPDTGGNPTVEVTEFVPDNCTPEDGMITAYLYNVSNCTVNLVVGFTIDDGPIQYAYMKADNVTNSVACPIYPPSMQE